LAAPAPLARQLHVPKRSNTRIAATNGATPPIDNMTPIGHRAARTMNLPPHHQVHRPAAGDVLLSSVTERWQVDAFDEPLALAEQDGRDGNVQLVE
jgi:hypothetical protein